MQTLASHIEHTLLRPDGSEADHGQLCADAARLGLAGVCVLPTRIAPCVDLLARAGADTVRVVTVVGFPLGAALADAKARETEHAVAAGAAEVDMVWSLGDFRDGRMARVRQEIAAVCEAAAGRPVKVIVETCLLSEDEKCRAVEIVAEAGAAYIKTSTGFGGGGATVADVALFRRVAGDRLRIKASGGIRSRDQALALVKAGADRIGTSVGPLLV